MCHFITFQTISYHSPFWMTVPYHLKNNEVITVPQGLSTARNSLGTINKD